MPTSTTPKMTVINSVDCLRKWLWQTHLNAEFISFFLNLNQNGKIVLSTKWACFFQWQFIVKIKRNIMLILSVWSQHFCSSFLLRLTKAFVTLRNIHSTFITPDFRWSVFQVSLVRKRQNMCVCIFDREKKGNGETEVKKHVRLKNIRTEWKMT